jgi:hypothetical protein
MGTHGGNIGSIFYRRVHIADSLHYNAYELVLPSPKQEKTFLNLLIFSWQIVISENCVPLWNHSPPYLAY